MDDKKPMYAFALKDVTQILTRSGNITYSYKGEPTPIVVFKRGRIYPVEYASEEKYADRYIVADDNHYRYKIPWFSDPNYEHFLLNFILTETDDYEKELINVFANLKDNIEKHIRIYNDLATDTLSQHIIYRMSI